MTTEIATASAAQVRVSIYPVAAYYRVELQGLPRRDGDLNSSETGATVHFQTRLPSLTKVVKTRGDEVTITVKNFDVKVKSALGRPLRVNLSRVRSGVVPGKGAFTAVDIYPEEAWAEYQPPDGVPCTDDAAAPRLAFQPPAFASGSLGFYMAQIDPQTLRPLRVIEHNADSLYPLASTFKQVILWGLLKKVDAGEIKLTDKMSVTDENRSIEDYQPGVRTLQNLAEQMIFESENTAADMVHQRVTGQALQALVRSHGACNTSVRMTTKAWWAAQGGLLTSVFGPDLALGAQRYFEASDAEQDALAARAVQEARKFKPERVNDELDRYFFSEKYDPQLEVYLQNRSTPREWSALLAQMYFDRSLSSASLNTMRRILGKGCCQAGKFEYWGSKAGSGWRLVTMSGMLKLGGQTFVYSYFNNGSNTIESPLIEEQIPQISKYILDTAQRLSGAMQ